MNISKSIIPIGWAFICSAGGQAQIIPKDIISQAIEHQHSSTHPDGHPVFPYPQLHPDIKIHLHLKPFSLSRSTSTQKLSFSVGKWKTCRSQMKIHTMTDGTTVPLGDVPAIDPDLDLDSLIEPDLAAAHHVMTSDIHRRLGSHHIQILEKSTCLLTHFSDTVIVWQFIVMIDGLPYEIDADETQVYRFEERFFRRTAGKCRIFPNNSQDEATEIFEFADFTGEERLRNQYFTTFVDQTIYNHALSANHEFFFDPETPEFRETSVFTNANRMLAWLTDHGYQNFGDRRLTLRVHQVINGDKNNALYQPGNTASPPAIFVGEGDGKHLQHLSTDADVVFHELGHHVIYHSIQSISGESLVIHEGVADFFTFAKTQNACLGESICPEGNNFSCAKPQECLRSGENDITFMGENYPSAPHLQGQLLSGMLWDLHAKDDISLSHLTKMVLKSIDLMPVNANFLDFLVTLMIADRDLYAGEYCETLYDQALNRGLGDVLGTFDCSSDFSNPPKRNQFADTTESIQSKNSGNGGAKGLCGVVSGKSPSSASFSLIIFLLPFFTILISFFRKKAQG